MNALWQFYVESKFMNAVITSTKGRGAEGITSNI